MPSFFLPAFVAGAVVLALVARLLRGRFFARFVGVIFTITLLITWPLADRLGPVEPIVWWVAAASLVHFGSLIRAKMRPVWVRVLINWPASWGIAGVFLALPWAITDAFGYDLPGLWVPFALAAAGVAESLWPRRRTVDVVLDGEDVGDTSRPWRSPAPPETRPLRIVQITDPHLGPFMSADRLHGISQRAVAAEPDIVLLTGDYMTMESHHDVEGLSHGLAPLAALPGRVFACRGNHDLESPETVDIAMERIGATLLNDDAAVVETPVGPVQIVGHDFAWRDRAERMAATNAAHPRVGDALRLVLLHDPGAFAHLDPDDADLVFSGHTHGGQLGLVSLGLQWTVLRALSRIPDHGLHARGRARLFVHRGTGHYGFPVRIGVPPEEPVLRVFDRRG